MLDGMVVNQYWIDYVVVVFQVELFFVYCIVKVDFYEYYWMMFFVVGVVNDYVMVKWVFEFVGYFFVFGLVFYIYFEMYLVFVVFFKMFDIVCVQ